MSFSKIYLHRLEELLSQMKELNQQTYINNSLDILAIENAINYIKLSTKENNRLQEKIKELENQHKQDCNIINIYIGGNE